MEDKKKSTTRRKRKVSDGSDSDYNPETKKKTRIKVGKSENEPIPRLPRVKKDAGLPNKTDLKATKLQQVTAEIVNTKNVDAVSSMRLKVQKGSTQSTALRTYKSPEVKHDIAIMKNEVVPGTTRPRAQKPTSPIKKSVTTVTRPVNMSPDRNSDIPSATVSIESDVHKEKVSQRVRKNEDMCNDDDDRHSLKLWDEASMLSYQQKVPMDLANNFVSLLEQGCTLPFIARYRKKEVFMLMPDRLQDLYESYQNISQLKKKIKTILETLRKSKKLTPAVENSLLNAHSLSELDLVYAPLKSHSLSLAEKARKLGLEPVAVRALNGDFINTNLLCTNNEELSSPDKVDGHITHIIADIIYKDTRVLEQMRNLKEETRFTIQTSRTKSSTKEQEKENNMKTDSKSDPETYKMYFDWKCPSNFIKPHQTLAMNRGEDEKILSVKVNVPDWFYNKLERFCLGLWKSPFWVKKGLMDAYSRLIKSWLSRQVRSDLTSQAHKEAVRTFTTNLEKYLLTEPVKNRVIAGLDPGFKAGCKVGIINPNGDQLDACTIYPNFRHFNRNDTAAKQLKELLRKYEVELIGLGNGTACRETELWLKSHSISQNVPIVIVPEQGASIYSISKEAQKEHPNMDPNLISALSIARRVLDPLGELIKVDPKNLGIGLYQHDVPPKMLESALDCAVEKVVSLVGVDINTASQAMLRRISGLNEGRAKKILAYRQENGGFKSRAEIMKVGGIGKVTFQQCAGFLKVLGGTEPLDSTIIHPESYSVAKKFAKKIAVNIKEITQPHFPRLVETKTASVDLDNVSLELSTDVCTLELIINVFKQKSYEDNVITFCRPVYSLAVQAKEQIQDGMTLTGVVRNVVPFGCFVDCGIGDNGLIHRNNLGGNQTPKLGDRVSVTVIPSVKANKIQLKLEKILD